MSLRTIFARLFDSNGNAFGTAANPVRTDPTGTTTQPTADADLRTATGTTADADTANTVIGRLKRLVNLLPTSLLNNRLRVVLTDSAGVEQATIAAPLLIKEAAPGFDAPARRSFSIAPADATDLAVTTRALYIGSSGNVSVILADDGTSAVTFTGLPAGALLPLCVKRVRATGTTATNIVGVY